MRRNQFFSHVSNQKQGLLNRAQELSEFIVSAAVAWLKAVMGAYWEPNVLIFALKSFIQMHSSFKWHGGEKKKNHIQADSGCALRTIGTIQCSFLTVIYL